MQRFSRARDGEAVLRGIFTHDCSEGRRTPLILSRPSKVLLFSPIFSGAYPPLLVGSGCQKEYPPFSDRGSFRSDSLGPLDRVQETRISAYTNLDRVTLQGPLREVEL